MSHLFRNSGSANSAKCFALVGVVSFFAGYAASSITKYLRGPSPARASRYKRRPDPTPQTDIPLVCDACQRSVWPEESLTFRGFEVPGVVITGGVACCEGCLTNLRQNAACMIRKNRAVRVHSVSYGGSKRPTVRFNREISTGYFRNGPMAEKELQVMAAELGCTQIIDREIHEEADDGVTDERFWASGVI